LLQFRPVSQHPAHWGHGPLPPDVDVVVTLVVEVVDVVDDVDEDLEVEDAVVVDRGLDVEVLVVRNAVLLEPGIDVVVTPDEPGVVEVAGEPV
jgi:hypothetical protein